MVSSDCLVDLTDFRVVVLLANLQSVIADDEFIKGVIRVADQVSVHVKSDTNGEPRGRLGEGLSRPCWTAPSMN